MPGWLAQFTNVGKDFKGTLDYILYTTDSLAPVAMLELPDDSEVAARGPPASCSPCLQGFIVQNMQKCKDIRTSSPRYHAELIGHHHVVLSCQEPALPRMGFEQGSCGAAQVQRGKHSGLPNEHWSSDHIALMAEFMYRVPAAGAPG